MPFRFRKTYKILPGVRLNLSKGGVSVSVGPKGYRLNFGKQGVRQTIDFPGEGLSHTSYLFKTDDGKEKGSEKNERRDGRDADDDNDAVGCFPFGCLLFILIAAVAGYFVADAYQWIPENYLSNLMQQVTRWLQRAGR